MAWAEPASAAQIFLDSSSMDKTYIAHISGAPGGGLPSIDDHVYLNAMHFQASNGVGEGLPTYDLFAFCIDIFHHITLGDLDAQYETAAFTQNGHGDPLSSTQLQEVGGLVNFGTQLYHLGDPNLSAKLAGVQGAIWRLENPGYTVISNGSAVNAYITSFAALAPTLHGSIRAIYPLDGTTQGFGTGVPEPGVWSLLIAGFGFVGAFLRRRRAAGALASA